MFRRTRPRANRTVAALFAAKQEPLEGTQQVWTGDRDSLDEDHKEQSGVVGFAESTQELLVTATTEPQQVAPSTSQSDPTDISSGLLTPSTSQTNSTSIGPLNSSSQIDAPELPLPSTSTPNPSAPPAAVDATPKASSSAWCPPSTSQDTASSLLAFKSRRKRPTVADRFASRESPVPPVASQEQCSTSASSKDMACVGGASLPSPAVRALHVPNAETGFENESFSIGESLPSVPSIPKDGFGSESSSCDVILGSGYDATQSAIVKDVDFEIWVETDINPAWCLEVGDSDSGQWRGACQTAFLRRKWEEFEALGQQVIPGATDISVREALELLGLPDDADLAQVQDQVASAFRQQSRACHPDKNEGANSDKFQALVAAYQVIQRSVAPGPTAQSTKTT